MVGEKLVRKLVPESTYDWFIFQIGVMWDISQDFFFGQISPDILSYADDQIAIVSITLANVIKWGEGWWDWRMEEKSEQGRRNACDSTKHTFVHSDNNHLKTGHGMSGL